MSTNSISEETVWASLLFTIYDSTCDRDYRRVFCVNQWELEVYVKYSHNKVQHRLENKNFNSIRRTSKTLKL